MLRGELEPIGFLFLSTPSARRAPHAYKDYAAIIAISIHALREEGNFTFRFTPYAFRISIHALREEGDFTLSVSSFASASFLSTPSARRATAGD